MSDAPARFERPGPLAFLLWVVALAMVIASLQGIGFSASGFFSGLPSIGRMLGEMFPPSLERAGPVGKALLETFQMALVGTLAGVALSLPLAVLATRHLSPNILAYQAARWLIALFRTVPDLVWALFFVVAVGLGPFAGTLAITVDIVGFCGRFFAEAMEEAERGPQEALHALGAGRGAVIAAAVIPAAMPSLINTALFSLEKATRSSVVLGLVGAGGIGIELQVSMDLFRYAEASAIIIAIFALVVMVEQCSAWLRRRLI
jgi:phosphonate transport system permease protein